ncbi:metallophosphoesterase [Paenibacillus elgii]|uniref:metallophosphoesterase n=1 Tax=Paenibacillus elgii TaxID=189691 RepID=UPI000248D216|nr:metallophosphoesterase [Paenibacillus elgii]
MSKEWFIADPHFGHKNILKYESRPFIDTEHMDNVIIEKYNQIVSEGDTVFWLGDMFFCNSTRMDYISKRLAKGRNILVRGNHDKGITDGKFLKLGFKPFKMIQLKGVMLTHEPISDHNMRYLEQFGVRKNIHGHVHSQTEDFDPTKYQCVSVEKINYSPIGLLELLERFNDEGAWVKWAERQQSETQ